MPADLRLVLWIATVQDLTIKLIQKVVMSYPLTALNFSAQHLARCSLTLSIGLISTVSALADQLPASQRAALIGSIASEPLRTVDKQLFSPLELSRTGWSSASDLAPSKNQQAQITRVAQASSGEQTNFKQDPPAVTFSSIEEPEVQPQANNLDQTTATSNKTNTKTMPRSLSALPRFFAAAPSVLPAQSSRSSVKLTQETANLSWVDEKHTGLNSLIDESAIEINSWFESDAQTKSAYGSLRLILDQAYSETDGYQTKVRVRGKLKLPALEDKVSLVFGDDRLDDELGNQVDPANPVLDDTQRSLTLKQTREENNSVALRISALTDKLPFDSDVDVGLRSGDDPYVRLKLDRSFELPEDFNFYAAQIYRYGAQSGEYLQTNLELAHAPPGLALIADQFKITSSDEESDDMRLSNRLFRQHQFFKNHRFQYGLYQGAYVDSGDAKLNAYGPYTSWRQPLLREWFFVQADLNYFNNKREELNHEPSGLLRLEALF